MALPTRLSPGLAMLLALMICAPALSESDTGGPRIHEGATVAVGNGQAWVMVAANAAGQPTSVSVVLDDAALEGLPPADPDQPVHEYILPMPEDAPATGYNHVGLDWNPAGHIPDGIYTLPHFDVHFYLVDAATRSRISFVGEAAETAMQAPDASLLPEGYMLAPNSGVEGMGAHAVNTGSHEFHGKAFDHTFIYGYHAGEMIFVEPMVTLKHLLRRTDVTMPVATPARYSRPGYYPTRYRVGFDAATGRHQVALLGLRPVSL